MPHPRELDGTSFAGSESFRREVLEVCQPTVLRGLVRHWPLVEAGIRSPAAFRDYLAQFDNGGRTEMFVGEPHIKGRYYYDEDMTGFNFERRTTGFAEAVDSIVSTCQSSDSASLYMGSVPINDYLPGLASQNPLAVLDGRIQPRIWLGHASTVSTHYDAYDNIACVVSGTRRFRLFPPEAIASLYVGPIDNTLAGQPVSLAASSPDDESRFPRFNAIRDQVLTAELEAGDAIYLPKLWWHAVDATAPFNGLVNYWWDAFSSGPDSPYTSLLLSMITIAERPPAERAAWKAFFDHYVFRSEGHPLAHLPAERHGLLGPLKPDNYGKIRARVMYLLRGG